MECNLCPRRCNVDRQTTLGFCRQGRNAAICRIGKHFWEEPCISGKRGSGTVFFGGCNLRCRFCQNAQISRGGRGVEVSVRQLSEIFLQIQDDGAENINLVTPQHFSDVIAESLALVKHKLAIPVVYNTNSYETVEALARLENLVDVYLPDLKFCDEKLSRDFCGAGNYFSVATAAIVEMRRQQPKDVFEDDMLKRGVIVRHLVLPGHVEDTKRVLDFLAATDKSLCVSLMAQYFPPHSDGKFPELNRKVSKREYDNALDYFLNVGLTQGYCQSPESATEDYVPTFDEKEVEEYLCNNRIR